MGFAHANSPNVASRKKKEMMRVENMAFRCWMVERRRAGERTVLVRWG